MRGNSQNIRIKSLIDNNVKKNKQLVLDESNKLKNEIIKKQYEIEIAEKLSSMLAEMGGYAFNKSHSVSYSTLCLQTAYLKAHYPVEFYKAAFNVVDKSKLSKYIVDANRNGVKVLPPNINHSEINFSIKDGKIMFGLSSIKGLGDKIAQEIINERNKNGIFKNFKDFVARINPSESLIVSLVKAGAIPTKDKLNFLHNYILSQYEFNYKEVSTLPTLEKLRNEWRIDTELYKTKEQRLKIYNQKKEIVEKEKLQERKENAIKEFDEKHKDYDLWEFETLSTFITSNPFLEIYDSITPFEEIEEGDNGVMIGVVSKVTKKKDRYKKQFAYIEIYSAYGTEEITCWAAQFSKYQDLIKKGKKLAILTKKKDEKGQVVEIKEYTRWEEDFVKWNKK